MGTYLDVDNWARRDLFKFFRGYKNPYFNICTQLDITSLREFLSHRQKTSVSLTYQYFALRAANEIEPFRYRLKEEKVFVYDVIHGATIVMKPDESFNFAYFDYQQDFEKFLVDVGKVTREAQHTRLSPSPRDDLIHFTILPWMSFTSFAHARNPGRADFVPKIAFGKFTEEGGRTTLPISVEVHHALMDGLHVGRYLARLQELFTYPEHHLK